MRNALAVGNLHAAVAASIVLPVVEGTDHAVVLDGAMGQVGAHMRAVGIEDTDQTPERLRPAGLTAPPARATACVRVSATTLLSMIRTSSVCRRTPVFEKIERK